MIKREFKKVVNYIKYLGGKNIKIVSGFIINFEYNNKSYDVLITHKNKFNLAKYESAYHYDAIKNIEGMNFINTKKIITKWFKEV